MSGTTKTWRTLFPVHPAADVFPMMPDDELGKLAADIKANGLQQQIVLWQDNADTHLRSRASYYVLDGRNRLAAMDLAGIPVPADWRGHRLDAAGPVVFERVCAWVWITPGGKWEKTPGVDPAARAIAANVRRRHLNKGQRAELIVKAVQASEEFLAKLARNHEAVKSTAGRRADPIKEKAVREGEKQGVGKRTIERELARQEGRPKTPSKPTLTLAPRVEPLRAEAPPFPTQTYEEKLEARVKDARGEVAHAEAALKDWRARLREREAVLKNYLAQKDEATGEAVLQLEDGDR